MVALVDGSEHRIRVLADRCWDAGDLEPLALSLGDATAVKLEGMGEECFDEPWLQPAGLGPLHERPDAVVRTKVREATHERTLLEHSLELESDLTLDDLVHDAKADRLLVLADGEDEQVLEADVHLRVAEDVVHLVPVHATLLLDLLEEPLEDHSFACLMCDEVPKVARQWLADAVDTTEPLLDAVGVPRKVVVHHEVRYLEIHTLAGSVGRDEDPHERVDAEAVLDLSTFLASHATVDRHDRLGPTKFVPDTLGDVGERVLVLGEDDELARWVRPTELLGTQETTELDPFGVLPARSDIRRDSDEFLKLDEFRFKLIRRGGRGRSIDDRILERLELVVVELVVVEVLEVGDLDARRQVSDRDRIAVLREPSERVALSSKLVRASTQ